MNECNEKRFLADISEHQMSILQDDGVRRHLHFKKPNTTDMCFNIITWPGHLCYCGDMGTYVFTRVEDMFNFFRDNREGLHINTGYWGEKCVSVDSCSGIREYSAENFVEIINEELDEDEEATTELREAVKDEILSYADDGEYAARQAVENFEFNGKLYFHDFWERTLTVKTFRFIWCCYALSWSIKEYDKHVEAVKP